MTSEVTTSPAGDPTADPTADPATGREPLLLEVDRLQVEFPGPAGAVRVVRGASFDVAAGEFAGLVGESGSGKTLSALSVLRLLPEAGRVVGGSIRFRGTEILALSERELQSIRGRRIGFVFQEPSTALNPVFTVGSQIAEGIRIHYGASRRTAREQTYELLEEVAIPDPVARYKSYPHELSGGQRQRVMIALALAAKPDLLIADEPTTALDVTVQAEILALLDRLRQQRGLAVLLITHDLAVVAETCDRVFVMYAGEVVEEAPVKDLFGRPAHPYTRGLLRVVPRLGTAPTAGGQRRLEVIPGQIPTPGDLPEGCVFAPRCPEAFERCRGARPTLYELGAERRAACFLHDEAVAEGGDP